jgi:hypothetical protein
MGEQESDATQSDLYMNWTFDWIGNASSFNGLFLLAVCDLLPTFCFFRLKIVYVNYVPAASAKVEQAGGLVACMHGYYMC